MYGVILGQFVYKLSSFVVCCKSCITTLQFLAWFGKLKGHKFKRSLGPLVFELNTFKYAWKRLEASFEELIWLKKNKNL